jgi:hypothetical protein
LKFGKKKAETAALPFANIAIHIKQFMGALTLRFFEGPMSIGPSPIFLEHWALHNRSTSLDSQLQMCSLWLTFSVYMHESVELWAKPYAIKVRCYWERFGGTDWELTGNMRKKKKFPPLPPSLPKRKKLDLS